MDINLDNFFWQVIRDDLAGLTSFLWSYLFTSVVVSLEVKSRMSTHNIRTSLLNVVFAVILLVDLIVVLI